MPRDTRTIKLSSKEEVTSFLQLTSQPLQLPFLVSRHIGVLHGSIPLYTAIDSQSQHPIVAMQGSCVLDNDKPRKNEYGALELETEEFLRSRGHKYTRFIEATRYLLTCGLVVKIPFLDIRRKQIAVEDSRIYACNFQDFAVPELLKPRASETAEHMPALLRSLNDAAGRKVEVVEFIPDLDKLEDEVERLKRAMTKKRAYKPQELFEFFDNARKLAPEGCGKWCQGLYAVSVTAFAAVKQHFDRTFHERETVGRCPLRKLALDDGKGQYSFALSEAASMNYWSLLMTFVDIYTLAIAKQTLSKHRPLHQSDAVKLSSYLSDLMLIDPFHRESSHYWISSLSEVEKQSSGSQISSYLNALGVQILDRTGGHYTSMYYIGTMPHRSHRRRLNHGHSLLNSILCLTKDDPRALLKLLGSISYLKKASDILYDIDKESRSILDNIQKAGYLVKDLSYLEELKEKYLIRSNSYPYSSHYVDGSRDRYGGPAPPSFSGLSVLRRSFFNNCSEAPLHNIGTGLDRSIFSLIQSRLRVEHFGAGTIQLFAVEKEAFSEDREVNSDASDHAERLAETKHITRAATTSLVCALRDGKISDDDLAEFDNMIALAGTNDCTSSIKISNNLRRIVDYMHTQSAVIQNDSESLRIAKGIISRFTNAGGLSPNASDSEIVQLAIGTLLATSSIWPDSETAIIVLTSSIYREIALLDKEYDVTRKMPFAAVLAYHTIETLCKYGYTREQLLEDIYSLLSSLGRSIAEAFIRYKQYVLVDLQSYTRRVVSGFRVNGKLLLHKDYDLPASIADLVYQNSMLQIDLEASRGVEFLAHLLEKLTGCPTTDQERESMLNAIMHVDLPGTL